MRNAPAAGGNAARVPIACDGAVLHAELDLPTEPTGMVVVAYGSGDGDEDSHRAIAAALQRRLGVGTLLIDLVAEDEDGADAQPGLDVMSRRLVSATQWLGRMRDTAGLRIGYFGASIGGVAALMATTERRCDVCAVVARSGHPDLAGSSILNRVLAPVLLIAGTDDPGDLARNESARAQCPAETRLETEPCAEETARDDVVAKLAAEWFHAHVVVARGPLE